MAGRRKTEIEEKKHKKESKTHRQDVRLNQNKKLDKKISKKENKARLLDVLTHFKISKHQIMKKLQIT